jgi:hypothetical protein
MWFCKKDPLPVINVYTPMLYRASKDVEYYIGLDKNENKLYFCNIKPTDLTKSPLEAGDLKHLVDAFPIRSIEKKLSGGVIMIWDTGHITEFERLEKGNIFTKASNGIWWISTPEKKPFERTGHPEFDLLECLFTAAPPSSQQPADTSPLSP